MESVKKQKSAEGLERREMVGKVEDDDSGEGRETCTAREIKYKRENELRNLQTSTRVIIFTSVYLRAMITKENMVNK